MASDWRLLRKKYPELPEEPTYEDVKAVIRKAYRDLPLDAILAERQRNDDEAEKYKRVAACFTAQVTVLEDLLYEHLKNTGADSVRSGNGALFRRDVTVDAKIQADGGAQKLRLWLEKNDMKEMLTVNGNALSKLLRERLEEGLELPDGVDAVPRNKLRVTGRVTTNDKEE